MATSEMEILNEDFAAIRKLSTDYFGRLVKSVQEDESDWSASFREPDRYWQLVPSDLQSEGSAITRRLLSACARLGEQAARSALAGSEDATTVKIAAKRMRAALVLRRYRYSGPEVAHDEGTVIGFLPASQSDSEPLGPKAAQRIFEEEFRTAQAIFDLVSASSGGVQLAQMTTGATKYRAGTAFIMMWMDPKCPELQDTLDAVREVFGSFGIKAVRADDIEHEGKITDQVLAEITESEFLFADLTGQRPNVYYEVGYAHALRKRVILYRKTGTGVHFDLSGYNCPEYDNLRDLKKKLHARLVSLTNKNPEIKA